MMKIAVCIKQVVTREWQLRVNDAGTWIRDADASFELNEPDAYALEEALRLKEKHGGEVVVCSAGPARAAQVIREALARGADRAIHVESDALAAADAFVVADALAAAIRDEKFELVLTGLQSDDQGFGQVGVVLAEKLGMPHATIIMEVQVAAPSTGSGQAPSTGSGQAPSAGSGQAPSAGSGQAPSAGSGQAPSTGSEQAPSTGSGQGALRVKRELEGGWFQWVSLPLPALLTIQSGINQLRYATLKGIMAAKKKEIRRVTPAAVAEVSQRIARVYVPEKAKKTELIQGSAAEAATTLVKHLRDDARVI
jgi:electron transfer flavoprotein beta subunit